MQTVLPLLLVLLLLAVFQPVDLHGLGGPGLPHISRAVGQSHGCESNNLPNKVHGHSARHLPIPSPWGPPGIPGRFVGWGFSLQGADRSMEAGAGQGPGQWDRGRLRTRSLANALYSCVSAAARREQLCPHLACAPGKAFLSPGLRFSGDERPNAGVRGLL